MDTHIVSANEMLYYAYFYGAAWQSQLIDKAPGIEDTHQSPASQALDSAESPHIVNQDSASHALRYAHRTGETWQIAPSIILPGWVRTTRWLWTGMGEPTSVIMIETMAA